MYRSSKMNEERVGILKTSHSRNQDYGSPQLLQIMALPEDQDEKEDEDEGEIYYYQINSKNNDEEAKSESIDMQDALYHRKESIVKYLHKVNLREPYRPPKINSSLELVSSQTMKHRYKQKLEKKMSEPNDNVIYDLLDSKNLSEQSRNDSKQQQPSRRVRLEFLNDVSFRNYMNFVQVKETREENESAVAVTKALVLYDLENQQVKTKKNRSAVLTPISTPNFFPDGSKSERSAAAAASGMFPPLTLNALMEYKAVLVAPGRGEFEHGRPKVFRLKSF